MKEQAEAQGSRFRRAARVLWACARPRLPRLPRTELAEAVRDIRWVAQLVQQRTVHGVEASGRGLPAAKAAGAAARPRRAGLRADGRRGRRGGAVERGVGRGVRGGRVVGGSRIRGGIGCCGSGGGSLLLRGQLGLLAGGLGGSALDVGRDAAGEWCGGTRRDKQPSGEGSVTSPSGLRAVQVL